MTHSQVFLDYNTLLHSIALRLLKCKADAEDAVHDAFEKWLSIDNQGIKNAKAYLTTMVTHICLNRLKKSSNLNEESIEMVPQAEKKKWFKELDINHIDFEKELSRALAILHSKLEPLERAVVLLKEVFNFDYESLQNILGKKAENCRQILSRAKKKLGNATEIHINLPKSSILDSFKKACYSGNSKDLISVLKKEI